MSEAAETGLTPWRSAMFAERAKRINLLIQQARMYLATGRGDAGPLLMEAQTLSADHHRELFTAAGIAALPDIPSTVEPLPLHLLDTPDVRALLAKLEEAQEIAERVDASRGRCLPPDFPLQPGESRGTDLAETISEIALRLRIEAYGPRGKE